jgi:hypothetical protein
MRRTPLGEWLGFLLVVRRLTPQDEPGRLAGREEPLSGLDHDREGLSRRSLPRHLALRQAPALRIAGDRRLTPRIATPLDLATQAQRIVAAGVPPFQEIGCIGMEDTGAPVTASPARGQGGGAEIAKHRILADAELGGQGMPRPPSVVQRPHLLVERHPSCPALGALLRRSRGDARWGDSNRHGALRPAHPLTPSPVIDGVERRPMRMEHGFKGFHQMLEEVKPISHLGGRGCPLASTVRLGSGSVARDDLHPRVGPQPRRQRRGLTIGPQGERLPAF